MGKPSKGVNIQSSHLTWIHASKPSKCRKVWYSLLQIVLKSDMFDLKIKVLINTHEIKKERIPIKSKRKGIIKGKKPEEWFLIN